MKMRLLLVIGFILFLVSGAAMAQKIRIHVNVPGAYVTYNHGNYNHYRNYRHHNRVRFDFRVYPRYYNYYNVPYPYVERVYRPVIYNRYPSGYNYTGYPTYYP